MATLILTLFQICVGRLLHMFSLDSLTNRLYIVLNVPKITLQNVTRSVNKISSH